MTLTESDLARMRELSRDIDPLDAENEDRRRRGLMEYHSLDSPREGLIVGTKGHPLTEGISPAESIYRYNEMTELQAAKIRNCKCRDITESWRGGYYCRRCGKEFDWRLSPVK